MNIKKWIEKNTASLFGKTVAVTGSTGGLGREICKYLAFLGADLILLDRNPEKAAALKQELNKEYPKTDILTFTVNLESEESVISVCEKLENMPIDFFLHNAGAYSIPRHKCKTGFDNVFQINFASPYYIINRLLPTLRERKGKVIVVGSIAHNYSKSDAYEPDFASKKKASLVYGNAKRYLMFSLFSLFKNETEVSLTVAHPGITFTNITAHYPKLIFALIKHPMKIIFMKPKSAALSIISAFFTDCGYCEWIGPRYFNIWGRPKKQKLKTCGEEEIQQISLSAENILKQYALE